MMNNTSKWYVATLSACVIVDEDTQLNAIRTGCLDLTELCNRPIMPNDIKVCRLATPHEIAVHTYTPEYLEIKDV